MHDYIYCKSMTEHFIKSMSAIFSLKLEFQALGCHNLITYNLLFLKKKEARTGTKIINERICKNPNFHFVGKKKHLQLERGPFFPDVQSFSVVARF